MASIQSIGAIYQSKSILPSNQKVATAKNSKLTIGSYKSHLLYSNIGLRTARKSKHAVDPCKEFLHFPTEEQKEAIKNCNEASNTLLMLP